MIRGEIKVFSGNANEPLARSICAHLGIEIGKLEVGRFKDGEISVSINESVRGRDVYLVQPTSTPVNDSLMEALILIDAFKRASAGRVNYIIPYYGYARQDRKTRGREPITAKLVANLIAAAGADRVIAMDLHAGQIQGYFDIPVDHMSASRRLAGYFTNIVDDSYVVVSPDLGGVTRARKFANHLNLPIAIIEKIRPRPNVSEVVNIIGDIEGRNCIIFDDIIDTAGTITNAANFLKENGAQSVYITAVHGVLSGEATKNIESSAVEKCILTDTIYLPKSKRTKKIQIVSVANLFADIIKAINADLSVSALFE